MTSPDRAAQAPHQLLASGDGRLLFATRTTRLFAYGFLSVILVLYLASRGLSETKIGLLLTLSLLGDTVLSVAITTHADRWGRKRMLVLGAALMAAAGIVFASTDGFLLLLLAATLGVISPSGNEVGPFLAIEQAALAQLLPGVHRTRIFARIAARIGLVKTMVFTHLPSNVLLVLVPLMPTLELAVLLLLMRFAISQMDVPTRQSYVMAVVRPDERSAAAGITGVARTTGAALSPLLSAMLLGSAHFISVPFFLAGGLKILYDLLLYRSFVGLRAPEEK